jgi:CRISPR-associated endonuclease Cas2
MQNYIIAYDVFHPKRLYKIKKLAYSYAMGGQKSALEAPLDKNLMKELVQQLQPLIKKEDKINIIRFFDKPILLGRACWISYENNGVVVV